jgi:membrane protease YdiL (CAAX protease family)
LAEISNRTGSDKIPRVLEVMLFVAAMLWAGAASVAASRAAAGLSTSLHLAYGQNLLESLFLLFLAVVGFQALDFIATRGAHRPEVLALPTRNTAPREWGSGFALGWGLSLAAVLPLLLTGHFHALLNRGPGVLPGVLAAILTLAVAALAEEVIFRGYPFKRLVQAIGPAWASLVLSVLFALVLVGSAGPRTLKWALTDAFLFGVLLAVCYLRTHALWFGWGLHFAYRVMMAVILGLPVVGRSDFGALIDGNASGPRWLSGGAFGLDATAFTALLMLLALALAYRVSKDWAWAYTLPVIVPGGDEVVVAPPAAHLAMEKSSSAAPPPLVQIMPVTSQTFSARDEPAPPR